MKARRLRIYFGVLRCRQWFLLLFTRARQRATTAAVHRDRRDAVRGARGVPKPVVKAAGDQLATLYDAWGKPDKAAEAREKLK